MTAAMSLLVLACGPGSGLSEAGLEGVLVLLAFLVVAFVHNCWPLLLVAVLVVAGNATHRAITRRSSPRRC